MADALAQGLALHQLENQGGDAVTLFQPVDGRDVGMVEGGQQLGFPAQAGNAFTIRDKLVRKHLQGNISPQLGVLGPVYLPHAAFADLLGNTVVG